MMGGIWLYPGLLVVVLVAFNDRFGFASQPNIVIFIVDDLGIGDVGCYGNTTIRTPNIDSIASNGVKFLHNLAAAPVCTPSRAALLTGRYPVRSGMTHRDGQFPVLPITAAGGGLPSNETTFASYYKSAGYKTAYFGKWHLGIHQNGQDFQHHPLQHGFDYYYGMPLTNLAEFGSFEILEVADAYMLIQKSHGTARMVLCTGVVGFIIIMLARIQKSWRRIFLFASLVLICFSCLNLGILYFYRKMNSILMRNYMIVEQPVVLEDLTQRLTKEVLGFINASEKDPFLIVVAYHKVHTALAVPETFKGKSVHGLYGDAVEEVDWSVGRIISSLEKNGMLNNSFVYFTSDHGPALYMNVDGQKHGGWNGKFKGGKGDNWEGGIRVPTLAMWPMHIPVGSLVPKPTSSLDLFPTLLNIIRVSLPSDRVIDGVDWLGSVTGTHERVEDRFLFHYCGYQLQAMTYAPYNSRHVWKLHFQVPAWQQGAETCGSDICSCYGSSVIKLRPTLLFDIASDPYEEKPYSSEQDIYRSITATMTKAVTKHKHSLVQVEDQLSYEKTKFSWSRQMCCNFPFCSCREIH